MVSQIRKIREELGLSQDNLALVAGEWPATLSQIERGTRKPTKRLLKTLAELCFDVAKIQRKHAEFIERKRKTIFRKLQTAS
ncbi:MAG: helix-turn-helix domain-containing protein [Candidatus Poribacteria bacterium]